MWPSERRRCTAVVVANSCTNGILLKTHKTVVSRQRRPAKREWGWLEEDPPPRVNTTSNRRTSEITVLTFKVGTAENPPSVTLLSIILRFYFPIIFSYTCLSTTTAAALPSTTRRRWRRRRRQRRTRPLAVRSTTTSPRRLLTPNDRSAQHCCTHTIFFGNTRRDRSADPMVCLNFVTPRFSVKISLCPTERCFRRRRRRL